MSVLIELNPLLQKLARALQREVLPGLAGNERFQGEAIRQLLLHAFHRRTGNVAAPEPLLALEMAHTVRGIMEGKVADTDARRLIDILHADSAFYRADAAAFAALVEAKLENESAFLPPDDFRLTELMCNLTGDPAAIARVTGAAVGGYSKQTLFFDYVAGDGAVQEFVMRRDLPYAQGRSSVAGEYPVLNAVFATGFPVAEPLYLVTDPAVLETPLLISRRAKGRLRGDSLGLHGEADFDPEQAYGAMLAQLHAIDVVELGVPGISDAVFDLSAQQRRIDEWIATYRGAETVPVAAIEIGLAWLRENAHLVVGDTVLVHGDVGYHNILFDEGTITALLDWELVRTGSPAEDVAYVSFFIGSVDRFLECYVAAGGTRPSEGALTWCRIFGNVRNACYGVIALRQFADNKHENIGMVRISLLSTYAYVDALDGFLSDAIEKHGFRWEV